MKIPHLHSWDLTPKQAIALQKELAGRIEMRPPLKKCELIAGAECSYNRFSPTLYAAVVVLRTNDWSIVEAQGLVGESQFPYVPGLLSFREVPIILEIFAKLRHRPDAVMLDGQGRAHPRRIGLACHAGLWLGIPTLGCPNTPLTGEHDAPGPNVGGVAPLRAKDEITGSVGRTKKRTKPVNVSSG